MFFFINFKFDLTFFHNLINIIQDPVMSRLHHNISHPPFDETVYCCFFEVDFFSISSAATLGVSVGIGFRDSFSPFFVITCVGYLFSSCLLLDVSLYVILLHYFVLLLYSKYSLLYSINILNMVFYLGIVFINGCAVDIGLLKIK